MLNIPFLIGKFIPTMRTTNFASNLAQANLDSNFTFPAMSNPLTNFNKTLTNTKWIFILGLVGFLAYKVSK